LENDALEKLNESLNNAMSLLYKLPESIQYKVKNIYFRFIEKNPDKLIKLNKLWTKLNPNSIQAHSQLGFAYYISGDLDNALKSALVVYNMDSSNFRNLMHIVAIHKRRKNYEEAIMLLTNFCNNYPNNHRSYLALGKLYETMGNFHKAKDQFETASLLEPNNNFIALRLCNLETKFGNFDSAINQLIILNKGPRKTSDEKYEIYSALSLIYKQLGQIKTSIKYVEKMYSLGSL
jgi:tetratricopeptide (TPR) repeat protein